MYNIYMKYNKKIILKICIISDSKIYKYKRE